MPSVAVIRELPALHLFRGRMNFSTDYLTSAFVHIGIDISISDVLDRDQPFLLFVKTTVN